MEILFGLIVAAIILYYALKGTAPKQIYGLFGLRESDYELLSSDLGKGHPRKRLGGHGLGGESDAIFRGKRTGQIVVGEFKNRKHKGLVRRREYYQVILYIGLARQTFGSQNVVGLLAFNDARVEIPFDANVFNALVGLRGEVLTSLSRKKAQDARPLHRRIRVAPQNRRIRFEGR